MEHPLLGTCFRDVFLRLVPCAVLFLLSPIEYFAQPRRRPVKWSLVNILRILLTVTASLIHLAEFIVILVADDLGNNAPVVTYTPVLVMVSYLWSGYLLMRAKQRGFVRSGVIWIFVTISTIFAAINFYSLLDSDSISSNDYPSLVFFPTSVILLLFCSIADNPVVLKDDAISPRDLASFPSYFTFSWVNRLAYTGWKGVLQFDHLHAIVDRNKTRHLGELLRSNLIRKQEDGTEESRGVTKALLQTFKGDLLYCAIFKCCMDWSDFITPLLLRWLLSYVMDKKEPHWHGYVIASLMLMSTATYNISQNIYFDLTAVLGIRCRTALMTCIYKKALTLSNSVRRDRTVGEIVNLMSVDADRFRPLLDFLHISWAAFIQITIAIFLLYQELGYSAFAGVLVLLLVMPFNTVVSTRMESSQKKQMKRKDERVKSMNEILNGMKVIKLYAWEEAYMSMILKLRKLEMKHIRRIAYFNSLFTFMWTVTPVLVSFFTFAVFVMSDSSNVLDPSKVFFCLTIFNILRMPLTNLPYLMSHLVATFVALKRLNSFFSAPDLKKYVSHHDDENTVVSIDHAVLSWNENHDASGCFQLDINMNVHAGSLVAVVGVVGSGKSSLISAILGEMQLKHGRVSISSKVKKIAYVPQQAWIMNETVKNNILFGMEYNKAKYEKVLRVCELGPDLEILAAGDETEIGEKGINLSGGQKQRLSVARACYSDADLFLFDDPLSAVDSHVAKKLLDNVFSSKTGLLKGKTRVLVTNSVSVLPAVDQIFVLQDGCISESGSYSQLVQKGGAFAEFLEEFSVSVKSDEDKVIRSDSISSSHSVTKRSGSLNQVLSESSRSDPGATGEEYQKKVDVLIEDEKREVGSVKLSVFINYFKHLSMLYIVIVAYILSTTCEAGANYWLSQWSEDTIIDTTNATSSAPVDQSNRNMRLLVYAALGISHTVFLLTGTMVLARGSVNAAIKLHKNLLHRIMRSPMSFFDTTPIGRIVNRFSKDMDVIDIWMLESLVFLFVSFLNVISAVTMILIAIPIFAAIILPLAVIFFVVQRFYVATSRQLRRLDSTTRSPIYSQFSETLAGVSTIRAYGATDRFIDESDDRIDKNQTCTYCSVVSNRWLSVRLQFVGNLCVFSCALFAVISKDTMDPGLTGLAITYAMQISGLLNWFVQVVSTAETDAVSIERVLEYSAVSQEADWSSHGDKKPAANWPQKGGIDFTDYSTRYREGLDLVLKDMTIHVNPLEKVGIVGRTGAGKSSITLSLFRIIEPATGKIVIDGVDVSTIGLHDLRSKLTIIPQDPVLFSGTLRSNLDPFEQKSDEQLWGCLESAHLKDFVKGLDKQLNYNVSEGGENLSVGQRQLICLARALLRKTQILVLDEATAAVDLETDSLIQSTIRSQFADCTILTIAHRLQTILDSDRVLVLDSGRVAEYDAPAALLQNTKSIFHSLAVDAGLVS